MHGKTVRRAWVFRPPASASTTSKVRGMSASSGAGEAWPMQRRRRRTVNGAHRLLPSARPVHAARNPTVLCFVSRPAARLASRPEKVPCSVAALLAQFHFVSHCLKCVRLLPCRRECVGRIGKRGALSSVDRDVPGLTGHRGMHYIDTNERHGGTWFASPRTLSGPIPWNRRTPHPCGALSPLRCDLIEELPDRVPDR